MAYPSPIIAGKASGKTLGAPCSKQSGNKKKKCSINYTYLNYGASLLQHNSRNRKLDRELTNHNYLICFVFDDGRLSGSCRTTHVLQTWLRLKS